MKPIQQLSLFIVVITQVLTAHDLTTVLQEVDSLILHRQHEKAYNLLCKTIPECTTSKEKVAVAGKLLHIGLHFFDEHKSDHALNTFFSILSISDQFSSAHHNIGFVYAEQLGEFNKAQISFEKALALKPKDPAIHFCYAISLLAQGKLVEGFQEYLWRWQRGDRKPRNFNTYPLEKQWHGESLAGKTIVLRAEQGLGDTLHFIRYAELLYWMGARVIAEVQQSLKPLLSLCPYLQSVISLHEEPPPFDYQIPYLDIPTVVHTTLESVPSNVPYLFADQKLEKKWAQFFEDKKDTYNIGICWHGNSAHTDDKFMPLHYFAELASIDRVRLFSLQKNGADNDEEIALFPLHFFDDNFDSDAGNFMDTAAVMRHLDLVITVDTSIAHLAGGLGVPVWVALPFPAEWRWLTCRDDSPWYPTMRLFRQEKRNNWKGVISQMKNAIMQLTCNT